jgi:hypothetical protein
MIFGIDSSDGSILREDDLAILDASGDDLAGYELFVEDEQDGQLYEVDETGQFNPIEAVDLVSQLGDTEQQIFHMFHAEKSFPDAAQALGDYLERVAENVSSTHHESADIANEVRYDLWSEKQIEEAARHENVAQPKSFDEAFSQSFDEGLLGKGDRVLPKPTGDPMADAHNDFFEQLSDRNNVQQAARAAVRAAAREHAER